MATAEETESLTFEPIVDKHGLKVSKSPWGADDEIGRLNWITPESRAAVLERVDGAMLFDLSVEYFVGMPSYAAQLAPDCCTWAASAARWRPSSAVRSGIRGR